MIRSLRGQVAAVVAASVFVSNLLGIGLVAVQEMRARRATAFGPPALALTVRLWREQPALRPALLTAAEQSGVHALRAPPSPDHNAVQVAPDLWLTEGRHWHRPPPPPLGLAGLFAVVGLPMLALSLWASRAVMAPLRRVAAQAEMVDPESVAAPLTPDGSTEIRQMIEAMNRLILRLTRYATDQRRVLAAISHDLRTPLTRLRLRAETVEPPAVRERLVGDVAAMQVLIDATLSLLAAQDGGFVPQQLELRALAETVADEAGGDVAVTEGPAVVAACDPVQMERALRNLVENALKYAGAATVAVRREGELAVVEVADQGPGLTDAQKQAVLEPWARADVARAGGGHGLGLAIAKAVMTAHRGSIVLRDTSPHGLLVRLEWPAAAEASVTSG